MTGDDGRPVKDTVKVMPAQIKTALSEAYERYKASKEEPEKEKEEETKAKSKSKAKTSRDEQSLSERAAAAKEGSAAMADHDVPFDEKSR